MIRVYPYFRKPPYIFIYIYTYIHVCVCVGYSWMSIPSLLMDTHGSQFFGPLNAGWWHLKTPSSTACPTAWSRKCLAVMSLPQGFRGSSCSQKITESLQKKVEQCWTLVIQSTFSTMQRPMWKLQTQISTTFFVWYGAWKKSCTSW